MKTGTPETRVRAFNLVVEERAPLHRGGAEWRCSGPLLAALVYLR
jgi:hypothetical protein